MNDKMISTKELEITFGDKKVLDNITFEVSKNEIFGFLGPSGAGKTTTIKILTKQLIPGSGACFVNANIDEIGILSDNSGAYERLSVYRNLCFFAELAKVDKQNVEDILKKVKLWENKDKKVKDLSKGMKQRLLLACAVVNSPKLLFLDEPTAALDPATTEEIHKMLWDLRDNGTTIFLTTHNMEEADKMCDRVAFLNKGQIVELGNPEDLKLKYANNEVEILFEDGTNIVTTKDTNAIADELQKNSAKQVRSIHSKESNLAEIFLSLTGRELK
ncbi:MAG: ABC transporter ATP-binding protein [Lachnospiraceae bacterium]|nr:ABC transporter ATP-binding protein [Lachnospiraceae bacterium]